MPTPSPSVFREIRTSPFARPGRPRARHRAVALALSLLCTAWLLLWGGAAGAAPRYNQIAMTSAHNSMQKGASPADLFGTFHIRSLEWDLHGRDDLHSNWEIYHVWGATYTHCRYFSDCLQILAGYHKLNPQHEVMTIILDDRDMFSPTHEDYPTMANMDDVLEAYLGQGVVFSPGELWDRCSSPSKSVLQDAVKPSLGCNWPTTEELRGRIIVALTGPPGDYDDEDQFSHLLFTIQDDDSWNSHPDCVFFNFDDVPSTAVMNAARARNVVVRVYGLDDKDSFQEAKAAGVNILASDCHDDPSTQSWCRTGSSHYPFECVPQHASCGAGAQTEVRNRQMSIRRTSNGSTFLYTSHSAGSETIEGAVTHDTLYPYFPPALMLGEPARTADGCLMARSSTSGSAYHFTVCRPNGRRPETGDMRAYIKYKNEAGYGVINGTWPSSSGYPSFFQGEYTYLKIVLTDIPNTNGVSATAYSCAGRGQNCAAIGTVVYTSTKLPLRGDFVTGESAKFVFTNVLVGSSPLNAYGTQTDFGTPAGTVTASPWATVAPSKSTSYAAMTTGNYHYPNIDWRVPAGATLYADLHGLSTDPDLYLQVGANPTTSANVAYSNSWSAFERIAFTNAQTSLATYRTGVYAYSGSPWVQLDTTVQAYNIIGTVTSLVQPGQSLTRCVTPHVGQTVRFATNNAGDHDLYLGLGGAPTPTSHIASSAWPGDGREAIVYTASTTTMLCGRAYNNQSSALYITIQVTGD